MFCARGCEMSGRGSARKSCRQGERSVRALGVVRMGKHAESSQGFEPAFAACRRPGNKTRHNGPGRSRRPFSGGCLSWILAFFYGNRFLPCRFCAFPLRPPAGLRDPGIGACFFKKKRPPHTGPGNAGRPHLPAGPVPKRRGRLGKPEPDRGSRLSF